MSSASDAYSPSQIMLMLKGMSPDVTVAFSEYTGQWYVSARYLEVGDGVLLFGGSQHRDTPDQAIRAFFDHLTELPLDRYIVGNYAGRRREYRWNGATFAECTRSLVFEREAVASTDSASDAA